MKPENRIREIRSGVFVIAGLAILVAFTLWIAGSRPLGNGRSSYEVWMDDAGGVRPGDSVRVAGIQVGRITAVALRPGAAQPVVLRIGLGADVPVTRATRARLASDGLLGTRFLSLELGEPAAPPLADGEPILGTKAGDLNTAMARLDEVVDRVVALLEEVTRTVKVLPERVDPLLARLDVLISEENVEEVGVTLRLLRQALEETGPRLPRLLARLESTLDDLGQGAADVPEVTAEARALLADVRQALGPDGERLAAVLDAAEEAMGSATATLATVSGNAGDLEAAMRDLRAAAGQLRALSEALRERPTRLLRTPRKGDRRPGEGVDR